MTEQIIKALLKELTRQAETDCGCRISNLWRLMLDAERHCHEAISDAMRDAWYEVLAKYGKTGEMSDSKNGLKIMLEELTGMGL